MQITLKPEQEAFIQTQLNQGHYQTAEDLLDQALALLQKQLDHEQWLVETRQKIAVGIEALSKGEGIEGDVVIAQLRHQLHNTQSA
ncbi:type II toxin-antitoxin system ParD family antitoxin [Spirulina sp. CCNP1310]|uniref:ribbon-helix-helix domain-containing protein n=1 Tax=Spirulina sp. CCNP1310 TaxID=3110249 RepID=UPI002B215375|nr:type II toxin-antitoxin system ParD family antitoxin [Spirulina sp. CCNP1310]MEA5420359.1 type II toxin-antitoxin system ParD family antitoxin [Spirulina sp. CCNP1310]